MSLRVRRIVLAAAVMPLVVLVGLRSVWAGYVCSMDGAVRAECCCPKKKDAERPPADGTPRLAAPGCCEVTIGRTEAAPDAREPDRIRSHEAPLVLLDTPPELSLAPRAKHEVPRAVLARPPPRPTPTYLANLTILR